MKLDRQLKQNERPAREPLTLRASEVGMVDTCPRKMWYTYHTPEHAAALDGTAIMKFLYGDIIEETVITLAKAAGHEVTDEQREIRFTLGHYTVVGHIDAVIDGVLVDVKSTTPYGIKDFEAGRGGDKFGYRAQINVYSVGTGVKEKGWLAVDKQVGTIIYAPEDNPYDVYALFDKAIATLAVSNEGSLARRRTEYEGASGNMKLDLECSYCSFRKYCWKDANGGRGIRSFLYGEKVVHLVHVAREPRVKEVT